MDFQKQVKPVSDYESLIIYCSYEIQNISPTRETLKSATCIESKITKSRRKNQLLKRTISDHYNFVWIVLNMGCNKEIEISQRRRYL